jgi:hypothetical protein
MQLRSILLLAWLVAACKPAAHGGQPTGSAAPLPTHDARSLPFARLALDEGAELALSFGAHNDYGWPVLAQLSAAGPEAAPVEVAWPAHTPHADPARSTAAWTLGGPDAEGPIELSAQRAQLAAGHAAWLLSSAGGFEHIKRRYDLLAVHDGALQAVWSWAEPQGPAASRVLVRRAGGSDELILISEILLSEVDQLDEVEVVRVAYDAASGNVAAHTLGCDPGLRYVAYRSFRTLEAALAAKAEPCATAALQPLVLQDPRGGLMLAQLSESQGTTQLVAQGEQCWPDTRPAVLDFCPAK